MLEKLLYQYFGYSSFRPGQKEIIEQVLQGKNVLGILPTGSGKSVCYQLPSLIQSGLTIVVSPLIALMEDQVYQLREKGLPIATYINSHTSFQEYLHRWEQIKKGKYKLLYVSPEKFQQKNFLERLKKMKVSLFVIDEAHCISEWGHDFRVDYLRLKKSIQELGEPPVLCLTATATSFVQKDIIHQLGLKSVQQVVTTFDRVNIAYQIIPVQTIEEKRRTLFQSLKQLKGAGIIYVNMRATSEAITNELKMNGFYGIEAYHAGLSPEDRMIIQQQFMREELRVIVATKAFGMGIDKKNIRFVIHYDIPNSIESYVQETGRVARDGGQGIAILIYQQGNEDTVLHLIDSEYPEIGQIDWVCQQINQHLINSPIIFDFETYSSLGLTMEKLELILFYIEKENQIIWRREQTQFVVTKVMNDPIMPQIISRYFFIRKRKRIKDLEAMRNYITGATCRREQILRYFDETVKQKPELCCDICGLKQLPFETGEFQEPQREAFHWQQELDRLLPLREG
ncbi:RecQ family ATP-dependent DNA helicase [Tepidibacillus fermentans]|uniref:ATP-dependent DNA helicase RecQ n=1 Tax=Tepidibacillus fermentans TaxID=1281767 RepID=A0A4R3KKF0_9BACI|nr:ATP-dependent DNA helicase RecQ [Tepidibacillus fermentans]TCS84107.1 ATP-dependent DNA helicase RecQ [Tepidibacillus fermentans]